MRARSASANQGGEEEGGALPKLLVIVTGKGPMRDEYMEKVGNLQEGWEWVRCVSHWLEAEDYPLLLGERFSDSLRCVDVQRNGGTLYVRFC